MQPLLSLAVCDGVIAWAVEVEVWRLDPPMLRRAPMFALARVYARQCATTAVKDAPIVDIMEPNVTASYWSWICY
jgi:hypothetical protein